MTHTSSTRLHRPIGFRSASIFLAREQTQRISQKVVHSTLTREYRGKSKTRQSAPATSLSFATFAESHLSVRTRPVSTSYNKRLLRRLVSKTLLSQDRPRLTMPLCRTLTHAPQISLSLQFRRLNDGTVEDLPANSFKTD